MSGQIEKHGCDVLFTLEHDGQCDSRHAWASLLPGGASHRVIGLIIGGSLVGLGMLLLLAELTGIRFFRVLWPLFIIVPGVLLFITSLSLPMPLGEIVMSPACILSALGLLLFYQNLFKHWESWAYGWALIAPTSIGIGHVFYGEFKNRPEMVQLGWSTARLGLTMFAIGFVFFELLLNISGFGLGIFGWAVLLIGWGAYLLLKNMLGRSGAVESDAGR